MRTNTRRQPLTKPAKKIHTILDRHQSFVKKLQENYKKPEKETSANTLGDDVIW